MKVNRKLKFTFLITERSLWRKFSKYLESRGFDKYFSFYAKGSASSTILEVLGVGESEKIVVIYPSNEEDSVNLMECIKESEYIKNTIVFRVPVSGISNMRSLEYFLKEEINHE